MRRIAIQLVVAVVLAAAGVGSAYAAVFGMTVSPTATTIGTVTLNGDDQTKTFNETITVTGQGSTGFNVSAYAAAPSGAAGSLSQLLADSPSVTCTGGSCTTGAPSATPTFPVTLPTSAGTEIYSTGSNTKGNEVITVPFIEPFTAAAFPGTYTTTINLSVANGP